MAGILMVKAISKYTGLQVSLMRSYLSGSKENMVNIILQSEALKTSEIMYEARKSLVYVVNEVDWPEYI